MPTKPTPTLRARCRPGQPGRSRTYPRLDIEADEHALGIGQIADDFPERRGQMPYDGRYRQDLIGGGELRIPRRSMTSIEYWPARCVAHNARRFRMAASDFGVSPAA